MRCVLYLAVVFSILAVVYCLDGDTFTVNCSPLTIQRSHPIVYPNAPGAHTHCVAGGNNFQRNMPGMYSAANATETSCNKKLDHSNYWVPCLYHYANNQYQLVNFQGSAHYYQKRACDYVPGQQYCDKSFVPLAFPYGFRMVAGDPYRRTQNNSDFAQKAIAIMCLGTNQEHAGWPTTRCNQFRAEVYFPSCWDGKNIDTPNHHDHVAYPAIGDYNGGVCPKSHPKAIFSLFYEFFFDTSPFTDIDHFCFANGDPTAYGYHGDFMMGWLDRDKLQTAHHDCVTAQDCPTLGNQQPYTPKLLVDPPTENVGINGPIPMLPGNNPINWPK